MTCCSSTARADKQSNPERMKEEKPDTTRGARILSESEREWFKDNLNFTDNSLSVSELLVTCHEKHQFIVTTYFLEPEN